MNNWLHLLGAHSRTQFDSSFNNETHSDGVEDDIDITMTHSDGVEDDIDINMTQSDGGDDNSDNADNADELYESFIRMMRRGKLPK